jgi:CubicO group peptidase (beta-lactamase class C family)
MTETTAHIDGFVAPGFEPVRDVFERNFEQGLELGAAFSAVHDGRVVVDLWGGTADRASGRAWDKDTPAPIFSGSKGLIALCLLRLIEQGALDLDAPVTEYWPEFAAEGKGGILVRHVVSHQAGLMGVRQPVDYDEATDPQRMAQLLAAQPAFEAPGERLCYHPITNGWLSGELLRRIDGRTIGRFFAEEVAGPLALDLWIGLPPEREPSVATLEYAANWGETFEFDETLLEDPVFLATWANPNLFPDEFLPWNDPKWHQAEIPSANGIGTARAVARFYGCLSRGGEIDGVRLISEDTLRLGTTCISRGRDPYLDEPAAYGVGYQVQTDLMLYGPPPAAFGHDGAGGSVHGAWPEERVGFSYVNNLLRDDAMPDRRQQPILAALHAAVTAS